jgi:hypothetical protein
MTTTQSAAKVRYNDMKAGDVIARFETYEFRGLLNVACGQSFAKLARRVATGDVVTVESVRLGERHGAVKGWEVFVTVAGTEYQASSAQWGAVAA